MRHKTILAFVILFCLPVRAEISRFTMYNAFNAGELSELLSAREELSKYHSGCSLIENFIVLPQGGLTKRPGTKYVAQSKNDENIRLIPFEYSTSQAYIIELGGGYARFYTDQAQLTDDGSVYDINTPYDIDDVFDIHYTQSADVLYLAHPNYAPRTLSRYDVNDWRVEEIDFDGGPFLPENATAATISVQFLSADANAWANGNSYDAGEFVIDDSNYYSCLLENTADVNNEPNTDAADGVGDYWLQFDPSETDAQYKYFPPGATVLLTSLDDIFNAEQIGSLFRITHTREDRTIDDSFTDNAAQETTKAIWAEDDWTFITNGTWTGEVTLQKSFDYGNTWLSYKAYESAGNRNMDLSGDELEEDVLYRIYESSELTDADDAEVMLDFDNQNFYHDGIVKLTEIMQSTETDGNSLDSYDNCIAHWKLDDDAASTTVADAKASFDGNSVTDVNTEDINDNGKLGGCFDFDGQYAVEIDDEPNFSFGNGTVDSAFSIAAWIYVGSPEGTYTGIVCKYAYEDGGTIKREWRLYLLGTNNLSMSLYDESENGTIGRTTNNTLTVGWHLVVVTYNGNSFSSGITLYVDGREVDSYGNSAGTYRAMENLTTKVTIGAYYYDGSPDRYFQDKIDNVLIYDKELSSDEVIELANVSIYRAKAIVKDRIYYDGTDAPTDDPSTDATKFWAEGTWSNYRGWPARVTFFEGRLFWAATSYNPQTIWGSVSDDYPNMKIGPDDDDALELVLSANQMNTIQWIVGKDKLMVGTSGGEWAIGGENDTTLTAATVKPERHSTYGSTDLQAQVVNESVLFFQRNKKRLRELAYNWELDSYVSPDMTILNPGVTGDGIVNMAYQKQPDSILWCVRDDGDLCGFTYERKQEIAAWHVHKTEGDFESAAVIPGVSEDEVWVSVKRTIDGNEVRYIEVFAERDFDEIDDAYYVDCGAEYTDVNEVNDMTWLEGEAVVALADGNIVDVNDINDGNSIFTATYSKVKIGLPFTAQARTMRLSLISDGLKVQGRIKRIHRVIVRCYESGDFYVGRDADRKELIELTSMESDDKETAFPLGYTREGYIFLYQQSPEPLTILSLMPEVEIY